MTSRIVTAEGLQKLHDELTERTTTIRQRIAAAIKEAKEQGDLSENAEYSAAKSEQAENEQRVAELEVMIKNAEVAEHDASDSSVQVGDKVAVKVRGKEHVFMIVGSNEADPASNKISNESPIGQALVGGSVGESVTVATPSGNMKYEITAIN